MDVVTHFGLSQDPFRNAEPGSLGDGALTREAARAYLAGRIAGAGGADLFSPAALDILAEAAKGDPDQLRKLGGSALFHAAFEGARRVEDQHARQAAVTQGRWIPRQDPMRSAGPVGAAAPVAAAPIHSVAGDATAAEAAPDPVVVHRRWWRRTPPITRLAIVVGLLLLSLPIIGYIIGVVKDSQSAESSYLPEDSIVDEEKIEPAEEGSIAAVNPDAAVAASTAPVIEAARPPVDLLPPDREPLPDPRPVSRPQPAPVLEAPLEAEPAPVPDSAPVPPEEPAPAEVPVPAPEIETVPIDPPAAEPPAPQI
jgi:hypothetical protein